MKEQLIDIDDRVKEAVEILLFSMNSKFLGGETCWGALVPLTKKNQADKDLRKQLAITSLLFKYANFENYFGK